MCATYVKKCASKYAEFAPVSIMALNIVIKHIWFHYNVNKNSKMNNKVNITVPLQCNIINRDVEADIVLEAEAEAEAEAVLFKMVEAEAEAEAVTFQTDLLEAEAEAVKKSTASASLVVTQSKRERTGNLPGRDRESAGRNPRRIPCIPELNSNDTPGHRELRSTGQTPPQTEAESIVLTTRGD